MYPSDIEKILFQVTDQYKRDKILINSKKFELLKFSDQSLIDSIEISLGKKNEIIKIVSVWSEMSTYDNILVI